ncbi:hypothetical protein [Peribacillus simplex]|uniref:hypothetical protein n=1 Tax=Peribacillus simplex TaxID=1478 RepID=UPI000A8AC601|nr:hypothetical protein [Peribacillus simplex]
MGQSYLLPKPYEVSESDYESTALPVHFERLSNLKVIASLRWACYSLGVIPAGFKPI